MTMKRARVIALLMLCCSLPLAGAAELSGQDRAIAAGDALIGTPAPKLTLTTIDGQKIDLAEYYGKRPVYLKFWATWCVPCLQQMPHFEHVFETAPKDLVVIAVNTNFNETTEVVKNYRQRQGLKMPLVMDDGQLAAALNLRVTPQHVLIARDGRVAYVSHLADAPLDEALAAIEQPNSHAPKALASRAVHEGAPHAMKTLAGENFLIKDPAHAKATVLMFLSPWCEGYLKDSRPEASRQCKEARAQGDQLAKRGDVRVLGIASGLWANDADLHDYQVKNAVQLPLALDATGAAFRAFEVRQVPAVVVLGSDGRERSRLSGDLAGLDAALAKAQVAPAG
jgi:peroxiredoxin